MTDSFSEDRGGQQRLRQAQRYCRRLARQRRENFLITSVLLPRKWHAPFYHVYAFCRYADDLADEAGAPDAAYQRLQSWQTATDDCFAGRPVTHPILVALADTAQRYSLSQQPFNDLLAAFRRDQSQNRYADRDQLLDYCRLSANPVGRILLQLGESDQPGCDSADNRRLADSVCTGLQLANHWQGIAEDFSCRNRVYLPQDQMLAHHVDESMLGRATASPELKRLIAQQCNDAREQLLAGLPLADQVPPWLGRSVRLFVHGGLAALDSIAACGFDPLRHRPRVSRCRQMWLVVKEVTGCVCVLVKRMKTRR